MFLRFSVLMISFLASCGIAKALSLEKLIQSGKLESILKESKVGIYVGSFDPIHKGHEAFATDCIEQQLCDYVILYPAWGGDAYKNRADIHVRHDMVFALFEDHPNIIVTRLHPSEFQRSLTVETNQRDTKGRKLVKPRFNSTEFIGVVGSDTAFALDKNEEAHSGFMTGIKIPKKYEKHTLGGLMALPVESFIVNQRAGDSLEALGGSIGDRKIIVTLRNDTHASASSTKVKEALSAAQSVSHLLSEPIIRIIESEGLYTQSKMK